MDTTTPAIADDLFCHAERLQKNHPELNIRLLSRVNSTQKQVTANQVLIADSQESGVGRRGHSWLSPPGQAISLSYRFCLPLQAAKLSGYQLTTALAITDCLRHFGCREQRLLKWPNDLCVERQKFGGILINLSATKNSHETEVIVGIGLNWCLSETALASIDQPVRNVPLIDKPDRGVFIDVLLNRLKHYNQRFCQHGLAPFLAEWSTQDSLSGCSLELHQGHTSVYGDYAGLSETGEIQIITKDQIECFGSGEVKVRPL